MHYGLVKVKSILLFAASKMVFPDGEGFQHDMKGELLLVELS
jgi:hypothetical protein